MQSQNIAPHRYSLSQNTDKDVEFDLIPRTKSTIVDLNWNILSQVSFDFLQLSNLQLNEEFEESTPDGRQVNPEKLDLKISSLPFLWRNPTIYPLFVNLKLTNPNDDMPR